MLNIYRYSDIARKRLFEILGLIKDRIWIPYQVAYEYQEERLNVISEQLKPYQQIQEVLDENLVKLNSVIEKYRKRHSLTSLIDENKIIQTIQRANKRVAKILNETKEQYPNLIDNDIYRDEIDNLLLGKIGSPYSQEELQQVCKQVKSRFEQEIPPGYKDKNKSQNIKQYGDAILWFQLIDYAKTQNKPIIFITDDTKEDWWKIHKGKTISPRPELIQEVKSKANVDFWMYTGDRFMMYAEKYFKLLEEPEVIEEAKDVRKVNDAAARELAKLIQSGSMSQDSKKAIEKITQSARESFDTFRKAIEDIQKGNAEIRANAMRDIILLGLDKNQI